MIQDLTPKEAIKRLETHFGGREGMMLHQLTMLSTSGQPADITFYRRKPILDVRISTKLSAARLYGLENHIPRLLQRIEFSNGMAANIKDIWTINPMPAGGFTQEELDAVDISQGDERSGPQGETIRKMIRKSYHCKSNRETDFYLRRWLAS